MGDGLIYNTFGLKVTAARLLEYHNEDELRTFIDFWLGGYCGSVT